jgi:hypothetical protein
MTTIAWDGRTLAADRRVVSGQVISETTKIRKTGDGRLLGAAGNAVLCRLWMDWVEFGGNRPDILSDKDDWINGIEIMLNGECWEHSRHGIFQNEGPFTAIGSGFHFALATIAMGGDAVRAVEIATALDPATGNGVDTLMLGDV